MNVTSHRWIISGVGVLLLALATFFLLEAEHNRIHRRVLFFPVSLEADKISSALQLVGEIRYISNRNNLDDDLRELIEEIILGPANHVLRPVLPRHTKVVSALSVEHVAYINLTKDVLFNDLLFVNSRSDSLQVIATSILYNFSYLQEVYFTIEGQEPRIEDKKHTGHRYLLDWSIVE